jgi:hypothetical protein
LGFTLGGGHRLDTDRDADGTTESRITSVATLNARGDLVQEATGVDNGVDGMIGPSQCLSVRYEGAERVNLPRR